jgi:hypothetical protein
MTNDLRGHALFCDDVRIEQTGKAIYIGVYRSQMIFQSLPAKTTLSAVISMSCPLDVEFDQMSISVFLGDNIIAGAEITSEQLRDAFSRARQEEASDGPNATLNLEAILTMGDLAIEAPTTMRVLLAADGNQQEIGRLQIREAPATKTKT